jgi:hypothetical protein
MVGTDTEGHYQLESSTFDSLDGVVEVNEEAERLLTLMNGAVKAQDPTSRPVHLTRDFRDENGPHRLAIAMTAEVRATSHVAHVGPGLPPVAPARVWLASGESNPNVADALELLAAPHLSWANLYKIWEILRDDVGGGSKAIKDRGWASDNQLTRFTRSANHPKASGADARHARDTTEPPPNPMALSEARDFILTLVQDWLEWGASVASGPRCKTTTGVGSFQA